MNNKQFLAPNRHLFSGSQLLASVANMKPAKVVGWEVRRTIPGHILTTRALEERATELRALRDSFRAPSPKLGVTCRKVAGNKIQIVGHGHEDGTPRIVGTFDEAKDFARSIGRSFVAMGAIRAKV